MVQVFFDAGEFEPFPIEPLLDLRGEEDLALAGVGHDPDPGRGPLRVHGGRDGLEYGSGD